MNWLLVPFHELDTKLVWPDLLLGWSLLEGRHTKQNISHRHCRLSLCHLNRTVSERALCRRLSLVGSISQIDVSALASKQRKFAQSCFEVTRREYIRQKQRSFLSKLRLVVFCGSFARLFAVRLWECMQTLDALNLQWEACVVCSANSETSWGTSWLRNFKRKKERNLQKSSNLQRETSVV